MHRHHYGKGRLVRTVVTREAEWDETEQAWVQALLLYRSQVGPCGHHLPTSTAAESEDRYDVPDPDRCHACTAIGTKSAGYRDSHVPSALLFHAVRR